MSYPVLANWIRFRRISENEFEIIDLLFDKRFKCSEKTFLFLRQLDGKRNPYEIDENMSEEEMDALLKRLEEKTIIRHKRFLSTYFLNLLVTVWQPHVTKGLRVASVFINGILLFSWIPMLFISLVTLSDIFNEFTFDYFWFGNIFGLLIGLILHEFAHVFACLAYGGYVFEIGITIHLFMPGAYVLMSESYIKKRMQRVQVSAAGIEMNLLLTAIFLILSAEFHSLSGFFLGAAMQNALCVLLNMVFIDGFDGTVIIGELLGTGEIICMSKIVTKSKFEKNRLKKGGIQGKATLMVCYIMRLFQVVLPLIFALNIWGIATCFM